MQTLRMQILRGDAAKCWVAKRAKWREWQKEATNLLMRRRFFHRGATTVWWFKRKKIMHTKCAYNTLLAFCQFLLRQRVPTAKIGRHYLPGSYALHKRCLFELHIWNLLSIGCLKVVNDHNASFCQLPVGNLRAFSFSRRRQSQQHRLERWIIL